MLSLFRRKFRESSTVTASHHGPGVTPRCGLHGLGVGVAARDETVMLGAITSCSPPSPANLAMIGGLRYQRPNDVEDGSVLG